MSVGVGVAIVKWKERYSGSAGCDTLFSFVVGIMGNHWEFFVRKIALILVFSH